MVVRSGLLTGFLTLLLAIPCAGQPPSSRDRLLLRTFPKFDFEGERRRMLSRLDEGIWLAEDSIKMTERALRDFRLTAEQRKRVEDDLIEMRKVLGVLKAQKLRMLEEEEQAKPVPLAPMPHEKQHD